MLKAVVLDDAGQPGNTCFTPQWRTLVEPFTIGGMACPSDTYDGGAWGWSVHANETEQFKIVASPDESNGPAESNTITLLAAPEMWWSMGYHGNTQILYAAVQGDSEFSTARSSSAGAGGSWPRSTSAAPTGT